MTPRKKPTETWTTTQVAAFLGYSGKYLRASTHKQLARWGIEAVARQAGRKGENLWPADQVRGAHAQRTGQGRRTDLHRDHQPQGDTPS